MSEKSQPTDQPQAFTREQVLEYLSEIEQRVVDTSVPPVHMMVALNGILSSPTANDVLDDELKQQARDLWLKVKANGLHLADPPLLFGQPPIEADENSVNGEA